MTRCPHCQAETTAGPENRWRPFCSERCKMVDLEAWFAGRYAIPATPTEEDLELLAREHAQDGDDGEA